LEENFLLAREEVDICSFKKIKISTVHYTRVYDLDQKIMCTNLWIRYEKAVNEKVFIVHKCIPTKPSNIP
jgi:hypothetical protein